jgi:hypothetical protein
MVYACSTRHQTGDTDSFQLVILLPVQLDSQGTFVPCEARIVWYSAGRTSSRQLRDTTRHSAGDVQRRDGASSPILVYFPMQHCSSYPGFSLLVSMDTCVICQIGPGVARVKFWPSRPPRSNERIFYGKRTGAPKATGGKKR